MAGVLAGNMLIRQGWAVEILERSKDGLEGRGAGIVPQRSLLTALGRAGVTVRPDIGIRVTKRVAMIAQASLLLPIHMTNTARRGPCFTTSSATPSQRSIFTPGAMWPRSRRTAIVPLRSSVTERSLQATC
jgi:2-polyprenyl-6-methoxyphenol hydroxylase-like FAD-dependent oxidoreductase